ncbi:hypothetical protein [Luteibaculum oceani]|uniref:DUF2723 domain-containing protein n=1 Tax=Luteibaculum oceani TaxID=1294296 RepID=A0A5C6VEH4_9FLAO|nr:hypothetical protein [Luteibaculum oceani]TXC81528.1 hypothetical protein FRX97_05840 [Luteibaculum oceani]
MIHKERIDLKLIFKVSTYPILLFPSGIWALIKTLYNISSTPCGQLIKILQLPAHNGINYLFYRTRYLNIRRYGLTGTSKYLGGGNVGQARNFHYPKLGFPAYNKWGWLFVAITLFIWLISHFTWYDYSSLSYILLCLFLTTIGTYFYSSIFKLMNYNAGGWCFVPLFIYSLHSDQIYLSVALLILIILGSTTVGFLFSLISGILFLLTFKISFLIIGISGAILLSFHLIPLFIDNGIQSAKSLIQGLGITDKVKYKRKSTKKFGLKEIYETIIFGQFMSCSFVAMQEWNFFLTLGCIHLGLYIINSKFLRFADDQTFFMLGLSVSLPLIITLPFSPLTVFSFWIFVAPTPRIIGFYADKGHPGLLPSVEPFLIALFLKSVEDFIKPIPENQKVLIAFRNPNNRFENIYDGYRIFVEPISYECNRKKVHMIPDWWFINDLNYEGAPEYWGTSPEQIEDNMKELGCQFIIIFETSKTKLDVDRCLDFSGLNLINSLDLRSGNYKIPDHKNYQLDLFKWHLFRRV